MGLESLAGALSGAQPLLIPPGLRLHVVLASRTWHQLDEWAGIKTTGDRHPDEFVEAIRWQIVKPNSFRLSDVGAAYIVQLRPTRYRSVVRQLPPAPGGRRHGLGHGETQPADRDRRPGVMLDSSGDLVKLWPKLWPNLKAAEADAGKQGMLDLPGFMRSAPISSKGERMKPRVGYFHRHYPRSMVWLETNLGPVVA